MAIVTRFAPSPTGFLHIGSARTALFNYLFARHHHGKFLLRVEDTDRHRSNKEAIDAIFTSLKWLGLDWDQQAVFQSQRNNRHKEAALKLLQNGMAYYCFTQQAEVDKMRHAALQKKQHFIFKSQWRDADKSSYPKDIKPVIRLKAPRESNTIIHDQLQGDVVIDNCHLDDMVLLRSDGTATYMLAVVVDDHDMGITHIIRGDDHLTNAARQILIYQAFGWQVPVMVHIPLIHGPDGAKLSKRHGALGVEAYKEMGYLPEALCNYLLKLGWGHKDDEIIARQQAIEWFDIDGLGKAPARIDFKKMQHLNAHYIRNLDNATLTNMIINILQPQFKISNSSASYIKQAMSSLKVRAELLTDLAKLARIYLVDYPLDYSDEAKKLIDGCNKNLVTQVMQDLQKLESFNKEDIQIALSKIAADNNIKLGDFMAPIRALITGQLNSPSVFEIMAIIGKINSINRLTKALQ